ncbi:hypothetical protein F4803DRAFT_378901 [Xylaria telfairii]|nr:hypothetical protein F4803DRAFT_378901 [Xylaria telfairii]
MQYRSSCTLLIDLRLGRVCICSMILTIIICTYVGRRYVYIRKAKQKTARAGEALTGQTALPTHHFFARDPSGMHPSSSRIYCTVHTYSHLLLYFLLIFFFSWLPPYAAILIENLDKRWRRTGPSPLLTSEITWTVTYQYLTLTCLPAHLSPSGYLLYYIASSD